MELRVCMHAGPADFVLNSLTSPAMVAASLACLRLAGRMAEISKRDIWSPQRVAQERPDVAYRLVAIDFLPPAVGAHWASRQIGCKVSPSACQQTWLAHRW
jgi:hypothetical protein